MPLPTPRRSSLDPDADESREGNERQPSIKTATTAKSRHPFEVREDDNGIR